MNQAVSGYKPAYPDTTLTALLAGGNRYNPAMHSIPGHSAGVPPLATATLPGNPAQAATWQADNRPLPTRP